MHDQPDMLRAENVADGRLVAQAAFVKRNHRRHGAPMAVGEIIQDDGSVPGGGELPHAMAAYVTGPTNNEYVHRA